MSSSELLLLALAGLLGGAVNAAAGGGSLLTFPSLVALGLPPLTANVTNTVAQLPGYASIVAGYREELRGQRRRIRALALPTLLGAVAGVGLLLAGDEDVFEIVAPILVLIACVLLAVQPRVKALRERDGVVPRDRPVAQWLAILVCGAYASYFGAAGGVLVLAVLTLTVQDGLQRLNALNRTLVCIANFAGAPLLALLLPIDWTAAAVLAPATLIGGYAGARVMRRLPENVLRAIVITIGVLVAAWLLARNWS